MAISCSLGCIIYIAVAFLIKALSVREEIMCYLTTPIKVPIRESGKSLGEREMLYIQNCSDGNGLCQSIFVLGISRRKIMAKFRDAKKASSIFLNLSSFKMRGLHSCLLENSGS